MTSNLGVTRHIWFYTEQNIILYIKTYNRVIIMSGFRGDYIWFIDTAQNSSNYSATTKPHNSQITTAPAQIS
jgi:hypothetical protein